MPRLSPTPPSPTVDEPIQPQVPYGADDTVSIYVRNSDGEEQDFTGHLVELDMVKELNRMGVMKVTLIGIESSDFTDYIKRHSYIKVFAERSFIGKFRIDEVKRNNDYMTELDCSGVEIDLYDLVTDQDTYFYNDTASDTIVTALVGSTMTVGENENLGKISGAFSWENKLSALTFIAETFDADWWVSHDFPYNSDTFNIKKRRGSFATVKNYYDSTSKDNTIHIEKNVDTSYFANDVIVAGEKEHAVRMIDNYTNSGITPAGNVTATLDQEVYGDSNKLVMEIYLDQTPQNCYIRVKDSRGTWHNLKEVDVIGGRTATEIIDISAMKMGDVYGKPAQVQLKFTTHASLLTECELFFGKQIQLVTQFSAVNGTYTKLDADLDAPLEETPFDIACKDSVAFPLKGIIRIGSDAIGYRNNEGNVLWSCTSDIATGETNVHKKGVLIFPTYDGDGKEDTTITSTIDSSETTLNVQDTTGFPSSGSIIVSDEVISYTGTTSTSFTGCSRNQTGTQGGAKPHSKGVRVFEYDSSNRYYPDSPKSGSAISDNNLKSKKWVNTDLTDMITAETLASSILEANLDDIVQTNGGLVSVLVEPADPLKDIQEIGLGDAVHINSSNNGLDDDFKVIGIRFTLGEYGLSCIFECGNRRYRFIEDLAGKWKLIYG